MKQLYTHVLNKHVSHAKCGNITTYDECSIHCSYTPGAFNFPANLVETSKAQVCLLQIDSVLCSADSHHVLLVDMIDTSLAGKLKPNVQPGIWLQLQSRADSSSQLMETKIIIGTGGLAPNIIVTACWEMKYCSSSTAIGPLSSVLN